MADKDIHGGSGRVGPRRTRVRDRRGLWGDFRIGADRVIARSVETGEGVGDRVKVEAFAFLPPGVVLEDDASVSHACLTNDRRPRAVGTRRRKKPEN
jgi:hypothetical protein